MSILREVRDIIWEKFAIGLENQRPRYRSQTYLALTAVSFGLTALCVLALPLLQPTVDQVAWYVVVFLMAFSWGFGLLYIVVTYWNTWRGALVFLIVATLVYIWFRGFLEPIADTPSGAIMLIAFFGGWLLGWGLIGYMIYKFRKSYSDAFGY